jgi:multicopper oxidase
MEMAPGPFGDAGDVSYPHYLINGRVPTAAHTFKAKAGQRLRIDVTNMSMMSHPLHLHGHTFAVADRGLRKNTVMLRPMEFRAIELQADNVGDWALHCHNVYHAEAGVMIALNYRI